MICSAEWNLVMSCQLREAGVNGVEWHHLNLEGMCTARTCGSPRSSVWVNPGMSHLRTSGVYLRFPAANHIYQWYRMFTFPLSLLFQCRVASIWFISMFSVPWLRWLVLPTYCWALSHPQGSPGWILWKEKCSWVQFFSKHIRGFYNRHIWGPNTKRLCLSPLLKFIHQ